MGVSYTPADGLVREQLEEVVGLYRPDLRDAGVSFGLLMAACDDPEDRPLKANKVPCLAQVLLCSHELRVLGAPDCRIRIDLREWAVMKDRHRLALLHHEVEHVELAKWGRDNQGVIHFDRDDGGRPKLKLRAGDLNPPDGFESVVEAHGDWSHEYTGVLAVFGRIKAARAGHIEVEDEADEPSLFGGGS